MNVVSFFAGCGGLDLGFEQAGFHVVWANEFDSTVRDTYIKNHPNTEFVLEDINKINPESIPDCDGFIGGPPCQSWSVGGMQKGLDDPRGQLFLKYIELIKAKKPKFFVIENVKGMLDKRFEDVFKDFVNRLEGAGYDVQWALLDAVNYRIPQNRERVFFVGFRKELNIKFNFPIPTCEEPISLEKAIGDIKEEPNYFAGGKGKVSVSPNQRHKNHDVLSSKYNSFYYRGNRRRGWQQPSFTINATAEFAPLHPSSPKMMFYGHENWNFQKDRLKEYRRLSVRECARIQTFPDNFIFEYDNIVDAYKMIGNAVPPRLGNVIAKSIQEAFNNKEASTSDVQKKTKYKAKDTVLVGYYKGNGHKQLILQNKLYYVRSDGRKGSIFKEDCSATPKYLLLHYKEDVEIYELNAEEPVLADAIFLNTLGFDVSGDTYLCFRLKSTKQKKVQYAGKNIIPSLCKRKKYTPFFTTIDKIKNSMNVDSEQITLDKSLVVAQDQPLSDKQLQKCLINTLGKNKCRILTIPPRKWVLEYIDGDKIYHLLVRTCTYLGNHHPIFKKRVQLPLWFNEYTNSINKQNPEVDVRYIGIYHYGDVFHGDNIIFIDFKKDTYLTKKGHNSSAHVYTNDLFQAMTYGVFSKEDKEGNTISTIRKDKLGKYLTNKLSESATLFDLFRKFNNGFTFGQWLKALDTIKEMHQNDWHQWRQTEWAGWFLEYKFNKFTIEEQVTNQMRYVGSSLKREGDLDFDIRFDEEDFYGDLKASDIKKKETPANDQKNLVECIYKYDKFWYVIYEHDTIKDSEITGYEATIGRNRYIKQVDPSYKNDEMSYHDRMKNSVKFIKMSIIELNRVNYREALTDFNQGHQPDGNARKPKFLINKKVLENDNFVVFRYTYGENK